MKLVEIVKDKRVLFITTKNIDYIRNTQEIQILEKYSKSYELIYSEQKNYILRILSVWMKVINNKIKEKDIVFVGWSPQFVIPFVGYKFKDKFVVIDFFISVYDTLVCDRKIFRKKGLIAKVLHKWDEYTLLRCNHVITDTKAHADFFIDEFDGKRELFETIYLEADFKIYYPRPQNKPKELIDKFVVLYFGSILPLQGVDVVLDAIRELKDREDIYFDIIGPIPAKYNKPIQGNVCYTEWLSQEELAEHIVNADLCLAGHFSGDIEKAKRTIPGKAYIYEAMGKNMILGDCEANRELFKEDDKHVFVEMGNRGCLKNMILEEKAIIEIGERV